MTEPASPDRDDDALAAEFALGVLPHAERVAFARRLEEEPALREKVRAWDDHLFQLSSEFEEVSPPQHLLEGIEAELFETETRATGWWNSLAFLRSLSLASLAMVALMAGLLTWFMQTPVGSPAGQTYVAELSGQDGAVKMLALYDPRDGDLKFNVAAGAPAPDRDFELWFIEGDKPAVSLGVLPSSPNPVLNLDEALRAGLPTAVLAISDEPKGGSPTGSRTGAILATGKLVAL